MTAEAKARIDYDGRRFAPVPDGGPAEPGADPAVGHYHQDGDLVWAQFAGAGVRSGYLVGTCAPDGAISAAYCLVTGAGQAVTGHCESTPALLADGRVRLTEHWRRQDGASGTSLLEEIPG